MTDRTTIRLADDLDLLVAPADAGLRLSLLPVREAPAHISATVSTSALLAAIDAADPDSMRAYLRETAPDFVADTLRPEELDAIPEADSPEDVAELPRLCDPIPADELEPVELINGEQVWP